MRRQTSLDRYFNKSKTGLPLSAGKTMSQECNKKRRSLSVLQTTPEKAVRSSSPDVIVVKTEQEVICVSSDDEDFKTTSPRNLQTPNGKLDKSPEDNSDSSQATIILTPKTPQKTSHSLSSSTNKSFQSPSSMQKFYSPIKKRAVYKRTPIKRNLIWDDHSHGSPSQPHAVEDDAFVNACEGLDDKSIFLLTIINKYLKEVSLKELLDEKSQELLNRCLHIVKPGVRLICRLFWRKHCWYRREELVKIVSDKKEAIGDPKFQELLNCLVENGLVTPSGAVDNMTFDDLTKILKADEIKKICDDLLKSKICTKQDCIDALKTFSRSNNSIRKYFIGGTSDNNSKRVIDIMKSKAGPCYKLSDLACSVFNNLYVLMYLGMNYVAIREKKLEFILINDKIKSEAYPVDKRTPLDTAAVVFKSRDEFTRYINAHNIYENYLAETETTEKCKIVQKVYELYQKFDREDNMRCKALPTWLRRFTPAHLYTKILECGVQELKKDKSGRHYQLAVDILTTLISQVAFRLHMKAEWYAEKALVLHKLLGRHNEAAEVLLEGLKSDLSAEAKDAMRPRANKIAKQQNIELDPRLKEALLEFGSKELILEKKFTADHINKPHMENGRQRGKKKFEIHKEDGKKFLDAEDYCIVHYTTNGPFTHGEHWEGRIVTTIYFLLFWDIIYTKPRGINGIFLSHFQMYPLDMFCESFYINRKALIDDWLRTIEGMTTDQLVEVMHQKWEERPVYELSGINRAIGWDNIRMVATCLGATATAAVCRRLATNYGYAHSGFPDLTLWNEHTGKIKFVEVKTDTDKPSIKQLQWMQYLQENGIDTGFSYLGVHTTRCKARASDTSR